MVLVDTSVWIEHFRSGAVGLDRFLQDGRVLCHPFVIGELACGNLKNRQVILSLLKELPLAVCAADDEVLQYIEAHRLMGKGLGYVDMHLVLSANLSGVPLWTLDQRLNAIAGNPQDQT
ncbi:type II toxin-antitoxin system VapC family toxin [Geoalkalibacter sp.]|uniref:type II toxin-antitoxin system VapC family toxin n=1 Tax=Geoalkalibacter sp. TaxID=3041440 RepID=UPI00272E8033|nr:PIN domain-containing protein [Geoalkalibacter sp.]